MSAANRGNRRLDVVTLYGLAGQCLHGDSHRHTVFGRGLDLIGNATQGFANLIRVRERWNPFTDQSDFLGGERRTSCFGFLETLRMS